MANDNTPRDTDRAWDLMKKIGFAMLVTRDGDKLRARPMSAYLERENNAIFFLTDARRHKDEEPGEPPQPDELPAHMPDELPVRGPDAPRMPSPATDAGSNASVVDLAGDGPDMIPRTPDMPQGTM